MALRDTVTPFQMEGQVPISGAFDQRVWTETNDVLEVDYYREAIEVNTWQYPACTLAAVEAAIGDVSEIEAQESVSQTTVVSARYQVEQKKTSPRAYALEVTLETRDRYKNGAQMPDPEI